MNDAVYKICPRSLWDGAMREGVFKGAEIDLADGFIHFSTADQVATTAHLHFNGVEGLVLVKIMTNHLDLGQLDLVWEESRGGQLFPHLYKDLDLGFVASVTPLPLDENNHHIFPIEITPL